MAWVVVILEVLLLAVSGLRLQPPDLLVTIRDGQDQGMAGVMVLVRDESGQHELARLRTDERGQARFTGLTEQEVRVAVQGQLPDGTPLIQMGMDAEGIMLILGAPPTMLDLRVEPNGTVLPDPVTMIVPEHNPISYPTAAIAPTVQPYARPPSPEAGMAAPNSNEHPIAAPPTPIAPDTDAPSPSPIPRWLLPALLFSGTVLLLLRRRGRS
jgi:hypothetical protein